MHVLKTLHGVFVQLTRNVCIIYYSKMAKYFRTRRALLAALSPSALRTRSAQRPFAPCLPLRPLLSDETDLENMVKTINATNTRT